MPKPSPPFHHRFIRRRVAWLPTVWGWLVLIGVTVLLLLLAGRFIDRWLSVNEPARAADGRAASTLVVEGWMSARDLDSAVRAFDRGGYERLLTTGGPIDDWPAPGGPSNYADRAAGYLRRRGIPADRLFSVPAPRSAQDRTFLSAVMVRDWAARRGIRLRAVDVFSVGPHTRRSRMVYRMAFGPEVEIGALSANASSPDAYRWWTTSADVKQVIVETISMGWTICCFWPPHADPQEARGGESAASDAAPRHPEPP